MPSIISKVASLENACGKSTKAGQCILNFLTIWGPFRTIHTTMISTQKWWGNWESLKLTISRPNLIITEVIFHILFLELHRVLPKRRFVSALLILQKEIIK